jgi:hypothetical protein
VQRGREDKGIARFICQDNIKPNHWSRVLEKLIRPQLVNKFSACYIHQNFISVFTITLTNPIQNCMNPVHALSFFSIKIYFNITFPFTAGRSKLSPSFKPPKRSPVCIFLFSLCAKCKAHVFLLDWMSLILSQKHGSWIFIDNIKMDLK